MPAVVASADQRDTAQYDNRQDITPEISGSGSAVEAVIFGRDHGFNVFHNRFEIGSQAAVI